MRQAEDRPRGRSRVRHRQGRSRQGDQIPSRTGNRTDLQCRLVSKFYLVEIFRIRSFFSFFYDFKLLKLNFAHIHKIQFFPDIENCKISGIAANFKLAKICSDMNKPNGQFELANDKEIILEFLQNLSIRKVTFPSNLI